VPNKLIWNGKAVSDDFAKAVDRALRLSAITVQGKAVRLVPVDSGVLKSSITYALVGSAQEFRQAVDDGKGGYKLGAGQTIRVKPGEAIVGTIVFYAAYVEYGTRFMKAQAFLHPAYKRSIPEIKEFFRIQLGGLKWLN
jgi:HK97 gp10 family phage protein